MKEIYEINNTADRNFPASEQVAVQYGGHRYIKMGESSSVDLSVGMRLMRVVGLVALVAIGIVGGFFLEAVRNQCRIWAEEIKEGQEVNVHFVRTLDDWQSQSLDDFADQISGNFRHLDKMPISVLCHVRIAPFG